MVTGNKVKDPLIDFIEILMESEVNFTIEDSFEILSVENEQLCDIDIEKISQNHIYNDSDVYSCDCFAERHPIYS